MDNRHLNSSFSEEKPSPDSSCPGGSLYRVSFLSWPRAWKLYWVECQNPPGHTLTADVLTVTYFTTRTVQPFGPKPFQINSSYTQLRAGRSGDRIPVQARLSAPLQIGSKAHPASYTMGTGSLPGVKRPVRGVDHPPHPAPRLRKE